jgi:AcrR family transcriptional regulator
MHNGKQGAGVKASAAPAAESAVARRRRDEIVTAATEIIASEGLHRLSLARIEKRTGMTRGQLTYYFPAKEAILLAVFDRMLARMIEAAIAEAERRGAPKPYTGRTWDGLRHMFAHTLSAESMCDPGRHQLGALIHTFMAQVRHREDYRRKLAEANAGWRQHLAADIASSLPTPRPVAPDVLASIVIAMFQGLGGQLAVDPDAFDRTAMVEACLKLLAPLFGNPAPPTPTPGANHE